MTASLRTPSRRAQLDEAFDGGELGEARRDAAITVAAVCARREPTRPTRR
jgi:hypothetical protein